MAIYKRGRREQHQLAVRTGFEPANYGFHIRRSNHLATLPPRQTPGRHEERMQERQNIWKTEISELVVNGLRKTRLLRTLSHSLLMDPISPRFGQTGSVSTT